MGGLDRGGVLVGEIAGLECLSRAALLERVLRKERGVHMARW